MFWNAVEVSLGWSNIKTSLPSSIKGVELAAVGGESMGVEQLCGLDLDRGEAERMALEIRNLTERFRHFLQNGTRSLPVSCIWLIRRHPGMIEDAWLASSSTGPRSTVVKGHPRCNVLCKIARFPEKSQDRTCNNRGYSANPSELTPKGTRQGWRGYSLA